MDQPHYYVAFLGVALATLAIATGWDLPLYLGLGTLGAVAIYSVMLLVR